VVNGSNAQEECLCRESTLYPCLKTDYLWRNYYDYHRNRNDARYTNTVIYIPNVTVLSGTQFSAVDVVSVAAPNLNRCDMATKTAAETIKTRIAMVMDVCALHNNTAIVLGALGCGAFRNDPHLVAAELRQLLFDEGYATLFECVYFAILARGDVGRTNNCAFSAALST
jgi:uncharacterized protein (TIGR02452 family)